MLCDGGEERGVLYGSVLMSCHSLHTLASCLRALFSVTVGRRGVVYLGSCPHAPAVGRRGVVYLGSCPHAPAVGRRGVVYLGSCPHAPAVGRREVLCI